MSDETVLAFFAGFAVVVIALFAVALAIALPSRSIPPPPKKKGGIR